MVMYFGQGYITPPCRLYLYVTGMFLFSCLFLYWSLTNNLNPNGKSSSIGASYLASDHSCEALQRRASDLERERHRLGLKIRKLESQIQRLQRLSQAEKHIPSSSMLPEIFFITPTTRRPNQKADLTRLAQTLAHVDNLRWIVVEDASTASTFIDELAERLGLDAIHLLERTPPEQRMHDNDPSWKRPKGVEQRNAGLQWIRSNCNVHCRGIVYFGDDDNSYDTRLFKEMRTIQNVGVWPVGIVGGRLVETPLVSDDGLITGFNAVWKPSRPFPIDMASFAVNASLVLAKKEAQFSYSVPRGYQESHFIHGLGITRMDLEPKAERCTKVYVWHTRTEGVKLTKDERAKFEAGSDLLNHVERDAIA